CPPAQYVTIRLCTRATLPMRRWRVRNAGSRRTRRSSSFLFVRGQAKNQNAVTGVAELARDGFGGDLRPASLPRFLVPTLRVGTQARTLRVPSRRRPGTETLAR